MVSLEVVPLWTEAFVFQLIHVDAQLRQLGLDLRRPPHVEVFSNEANEVSF